MASASPLPVEQAQARPSFAKVAATAYRPHPAKEMVPSVKSPIAVPQVHYPPDIASSTPLVVQGSAARMETESDDSAKINAGNTAIEEGRWKSAPGVEAVAHIGSKNEGVEKPRLAITLVKFSAAEDSTTQVSSSDGSAKPPSLDGKSVASGTTFAMDEKESIRPDDSASLRAVEEEDVTSPPESVAAGSRVGSDSGARAFRDQLREIAVMGPQPQRGVPPGRFPTGNVNGPHTLYDPNQPTAGIGRPMSQPLVAGMPSGTGPQNMPAIPDEKLIEALQSPRDRLFVVKLEQDFIDFIKDSSESGFNLPSCNTFYRMLAHRLADYYLLGHVVDPTMTGVRITRTAYCRIPPPLSQMVDATKTTNTPPVDLPARKIMRRGDEGKSGTNTTANSENPSKATSEAGGSDTGNERGESGQKKDKSAMTREEREARYREARQRIFGNAGSEENESSEAVGSGEEKDMSRSSSASGKKKTKNQRSYDDDGFETRSRFNSFFSGQYPAAGFSGDGTVYYNGGYPGQMSNPQYAPMEYSPPQTYNNGYSSIMPQEPQTQYAWPNQQYQGANGPMMYPSYTQMQNGYDLSADFQRGMQSFQSAGPSTQMTPKMANPPMATYQDTYQPPPQQMAMNSGWPQMGQQQSFAVNQASFPPNGPNNRPMSAPTQGPLPGAYAYGQFPPPSLNGKPYRNQHPIPGSYQRAQFNPQSQAFIPGSRGMPFPMQSNVSGAPHQGMNNFPNFQVPPGPQMPPQMPRLSPPTSQSQMFGSPRGMQMSHAVLAKGNSSASSPPSQQIPPLQNPTQPSVPMPAQSSIAKYGTPSHLPAKPPPQAPQPGPKFPLAGNSFPAGSRVPSNPIGGFNGNGS